MLNSGDLTIMSKAVDVPDAKELSQVCNTSPLDVGEIASEQAMERVSLLLPKPSLPAGSAAVLSSLIEKFTPNTACSPREG